MREARLIVPDACGEQNIATTGHLLARRFGGFTRSAEFGGWVDSHGNLVEEPGQAFDIAMEPNPANHAYLRAVAQAIKATGQQNAVYLRDADGNVHLI